MVATPEPVVAVSIVWSDEPADADALLAEEVRRFAETRSDPVRIARLCPACGSSTHGRPIVVGRPDVHLSLARAGDWTLVAVSDRGPVGVDMESAEPADVAALHRAACHHLERAVDAHATALLWSRKESLLKATGHGVRLRPDQLRLTEPGEPPRLLEWPASGGARPTVWMADLVLPGPVVGAVSLLVAPDNVAQSAWTVRGGGWFSLRRAPASPAPTTQLGRPGESRPRQTSPAAPAAPAARSHEARR